MYAILQHGGHQYRVASGDRILVDRIPVDVGSTVTLESVLLIGDGAETDIAKGSPVEASVTATVIAHRRGRKIRVFTYKPKKRHRRTLGYRSQLTELLIDDVARGKAATKPKAAAKPHKAAEPAKAEAAPAPAKAKAAAADAVAEASEIATAAQSKTVEATAAAGGDVEAVEDSAPGGEDEAAGAKPAAKKAAAAKPAAKPKAPRAKKDPADGA